MPELPEVETIVNGLRPRILKKKISSVKVIDRRILTGISAPSFIKKLAGRSFKSIVRRAKYIIIALNDGDYLLVHLGMTGGLVYRHKLDKDIKYVKWFIKFRNGTFLYYIDARLFGEIRIVNDKYIEKLDAKLGPEPLSPEFTFEKFWERLNKRKGNVKALLLNQSFISGIGNIYAIESLFMSGISPLRKAHRVTRAEAKKLHSNIKKVLFKSIGSGGTSVDSYVDSDGEEGSFQFKLKVYSRKGEKCYRCGGTVKRISLGQRGTYYCPKCQK
ncbi:MAG: bifunctional DNA-formamidopyrimidine glycosylase/DNA-(apurinic or apyrimidinic site) lyase [Candidatus Margulisbacteria bacterium]|nr:bifunctional DNA-formamidopyrimidine glycosylase/DNA-(apurinic or apyrimidinic site) lyase [Candidatus Margulisiibacteriota bacterium]MBU1021213.1 bifunctional DNA-formamidopyrimidine glycosylase/DNA-(apurinic or apyrimidinic site) lyase [Candidatus Margulisiibacteriota bacterium]MBU1729819.1 bifunctional DNA-formamidopyrimidine glycosylase/DNA-(apurinic or apyrimidinic site) lyase [Candidatus Margulisiibacteriota bacterium]MBU1955320.1 bifunctional DNA-formamidopyrimidine glycosylase/DNA-(ap